MGDNERSARLFPAEDSRAPAVLRRSMRLGAFVLTVTAVVGATTARADLAKKAGRSFVTGAGEALQPALAATLADVDRRAQRHEDRIGSIVNGVLRKSNVIVEQRLDQVDRLLEARLVQARVEATELTDHALSSVDGMLKNRLSQASAAGQKLVTALDAATTGALGQADQILRDRTADLGREVSRAVTSADQALAARLEQLDELTGRRLGNVDVIASKQRLALEQTIVRIGVLLGAVVFVVFVLRRLWANYVESSEERRKQAAAGGPMFFAKRLGGPFLGHVAMAAAAGGVLFLLYQRLPLGARREAQELTRTHQQELERSLAQLELGRVRFHASQLEYLAPSGNERYRALAAKAELLRDLFARPTLLATDAGQTDLARRLDEVRRLDGSGEDPDLLVVQAMLIWHSGATRADEHRAASLCARALRTRPGGFPLAPLAREYVEAFLVAPVASRPGPAVESLAGLRAALSSAPADDGAHPLSAVVALARLMRTVDMKTTVAYVAMARQHAALVRLLGARASSAEIRAAREARTAEARKVLDAWATFDRALLETGGLRGNAAVLAVFRLNDALFSRAKWFADDPGTNVEAPLLAEIRPAGKEDAATVRFRLAPPRVAWARRYSALVNGPARELIELQEAERFSQNEETARAFERALVGGDMQAAALAAARLGLFVDGASATAERVPFARVLLPTTGGDSIGEELAASLNARGVRLL